MAKTGHSDTQKRVSHLVKSIEVTMKTYLTVQSQKCVQFLRYKGRLTV